MARYAKAKAKMAYLAPLIMQPSPEQVALAAKAGWDLVHAGEYDPFSYPALMALAAKYHSLSVTHPAAALILSRSGATVGVFEERYGQPLRLHVWMPIGMIVYE